MWDDKLKIYDNLISKCSKIQRKGKSVPYTSANGYMFSILNKDGDLGIRFSKDVQKKYIEDWGTTFFKSHGATMRGYVLVPESMLHDLDNLATVLMESYHYVMGLEPK
ncbi:MAG: hypothetical protein ABJN95_08800 [Maribacter sp.]|uniref:hypothetical protein n=1 Tax=Maribacter sp. TaxID=1897614 RepID=UPI00329916F7